MSGVVGGAGSKSGVIGETELDYEEGTWDAANDGITLIASDVSDGPHYTKIGRMVTVYGFISTNQTSSGDFLITGLPYTNAGSAQGAGSIYMRDMGTAVDNDGYITIAIASGAQFYVRRGGNTDSGDGVRGYMDGDTRFWFSLTYETTA